MARKRSKRKRKQKQPKLPPLLILVILLIAAAWSVGTVYRNNLPLPWQTQEQPAATPVEAGQDELRIASWNIRQFGSRASTDIRLLSGIIVDHKFDIVAIQEVQRDGSGVDRLLNELGYPWRGTRLGERSRSGERLAYIYRGDRVQEIGQASNLPGASSRVFERVPYRATFRAGNFDFELITLHLSWGDVAQREDEMKTLASLVAKRIQSQGEKDIIILGDLNEQKSRPNLSYMSVVGWDTVVKLGTNLSGREIYDHILLNPTHTREYLGRSGVVLFDEIYLNNDDRTAADKVSDHRPVWADFSIVMPDDD